MWQKEDPFTTPSTPANNIQYRWARTPRYARFSGYRITPTRIVLLIVLCVCLILSHRWLPQVPAIKISQKHKFYNTSTIPKAAFQPPEPVPYRIPDSIDTFANYKYRDTCNISSLDLHAAFSPLCPDRQSLLKAMSSGGRIGFDSPYMPRGCDMRWFSAEEMCDVFGRFEKVILIGDSMLRHMTGSFNVFVRKDIGYGAVTDWNFSVKERKECFCNEQFDVKACSVQGIYKTGDVQTHDPGMEEIVRYPIPSDEITRLKDSLLSHPSSNGLPIAIIFGHGLWSDLDLQRTLNWFDALISILDTTIGREKWRGLFVTPNAAGREKADEWIVSQGNKALMLYEEAVGIEAQKRGVEHLGTWNMSIQSRKYDGVHLDMRGNLVKAMMVGNWLAMV